MVQWRIDNKVNPLLVEAVIAGTKPEYSFSFVRSGVTVTGSKD